MKNMEIERKYLVKKSDIPKSYKKYECKHMVQGYINLKPALRVRKSNNEYYLTVKDKVKKQNAKIKDLERIEYELLIDKKTYNRLIKFSIGRIIYKKRYFIPYMFKHKKYIIELDVFEKDLKGLVYAEVEFDNVNDANKFIGPNWFYKDVTGIEKYKNTSLTICKNVKNLLI